MARSRSAWIWGVPLALAAGLAPAPAPAQLLSPPDDGPRDLAQDREHDVRLAQQSPRAITENVVLQRPRPGFDAEGLRLGGLRAYPSLSMRLGYDDNVFNAPSASGDVLARIEPRLSIRSDWGRHGVEMNASMAAERFARHPTENVEDHDLGINGTLDVGQGGQLRLGARSALQTEARGSVGDLFPGGQPVRYRLKQGNLGLTQHFAGVHLSAQATVADLSYRDILYEDVRYDQSYRNRQERAGTVEAALPFTPQLALFGQLSGNSIDYRPAPGVLDFGSRGMAAIAGLAFRFGPILSGEAGIGYLRQSYSALPIPDVSGASFDLDVIWNPTPLLSVTTTATRKVRQSPYASAPAVVESRFGLRVDYELLRNLLVAVNGALSLSDYGRVPGQDRYGEGALSFRYLLSRTLSADLAVEGRGNEARSPFTRSYHGTSVRIGFTAQR